TPRLMKAPNFDKSFTFSASPSPAQQSPLPRQRQAYPEALQSPLQRRNPKGNNSQLYQPNWLLASPSDPEAGMRPRSLDRGQQHRQDFDDVAGIMGNNQWSESPGLYDFDSLGSFSQQFPGGLGEFQGLQDFTAQQSIDLDPDPDYAQFIQVAT
ncbi:hypothetical protein LTR37_003586, partial [Vermiconidia calcicola]